MAFTNPCCVPLQVGVKLLSIAQLICSCLILALGIFFIVIGQHQDENSHIASILTGVFLITFGSFLVVMSFAYFGLAILLWRAAIQRNEKYCRIWLIIVVILWIVGFIGVVFDIFGGNRMDVNIIPFALWLLLDAYFIWVVNAFRKEILEQGLIQGRQGMTTGLVEQGTSAGAKYTAVSDP